MIIFLSPGFCHSSTKPSSIRSSHLWFAHMKFQRVRLHLLCWEFKGISCLVSQLKTLTKAKLDKIHNAIPVPLIQNKLFYLIQILLLLFVYNYLRIILFKRKICCKQIEYLIILVFAQVVSPWVACLWILPVDLTPLILGRHLIYGAFPAPGHSYYWNPHSFVSIREFKTPYGFTNTRPHEAEASSDMS